MKYEDPFTNALIQRLDTASVIEQEALALALGFEPYLEKKLRFKYLRKFLKDQNSSVRRGGLIGVAFSSLQEPSKKSKSQQKLLKKYFKDAFSSIKLTAALGLGINAYFTKNEKYGRKINKEIKKAIRKQNEQVKQGLVISMGILGKHSKSPSKDFEYLVKSFGSFRIGSPTIFFIGLTLSAINAGQTNEALEFFLDVLTHLTSKESRRIAIICSAFLLPLVQDFNERLGKLENIIKGGFEFQSKFGTDLAIIFTYFSILDNPSLKKDFLKSLEQMKNLDPDYDQIFQILKTEKKPMNVLMALINSNTLDIKASGINASFFLESADQPVKLDRFIKEGLQQRDAGYFDRFLILLRSFSFCLLEKNYSYAKYFEPFTYSKDQQVKRIASMAYACLFKMNPENEEDHSIYEQLKAESDENVRWGLILGLSLPQIIGKSPMDDELILGLLLLCLGFVEAGMSLVLSQAMIPKFYETRE